MPKHIYGVIGIDDRMVNVGTGCDLSLQEQQDTKIKSLSELICAYKTPSSKQIHLAEMDGSAFDRDRSRPVLSF